ncbi:hypothetical protein OF83DRAFT_1171919 [Amylostereum chailletii]|nr:hypothetical protein OF83DRAFT_1171919 [Amylostereum chailletii]
MSSAFAPPNIFNTSGDLPPAYAVYSDVNSEDEDEDEDMYMSIPPSRDEREVESPPNILTDHHNTREREHIQIAPAPIDLASEVKGMYRVLDLIAEQGMDKVIIAQESVKDFINTISPGTCPSITRIDFKTLDKHMFKPIGIYGSKEELVRFLHDLGAVQDETAAKLLAPSDHADALHPTLRSGLYIVRAPTSTKGQVFVLYWPEDTTWEDSSASSVRRNRVTFMRYLTKMTDQVVSLVSSEHASTLMWKDEQAGEGMETDEEESDRLFTFEVAKTVEQEENVTARDGITMHSHEILTPLLEPDCPVDVSLCVPRLLLGDSTQGMLTARFLTKRTITKAMRGDYVSHIQVTDYVSADSLKLAETLNEKSLQWLVDGHLRRRYPQQCLDWTKLKTALGSMFQNLSRERVATVTKELESNVEQFKNVLRDAFLEEVSAITLDKSRFHDGWAPDNSSKEQFASLVTLYPELKDELRKWTHGGQLTAIRGGNFQTLKQNLLTVRRMYGKHKDGKHQELSSETRQTLANAVIVENVDGIISRSDSRGFFSRLFSSWDKSDEELIKKSKKEAQEMGDAVFLKNLKSIRSPELQEVIVMIKDVALQHLKKSIEWQLPKFIQAASNIRKNACKRRIDSAIESEENDAQNALRLEFIRRINDIPDEGWRVRVYIENIELYTRGWSSFASQDCYLTGQLYTMQNPELEYTLHTLELSAEHRQALQMDPNFIPRPNTNRRFQTVFKTELGTAVIFAQLLEHEKLLLVLQDGKNGRLLIHLDRLHTIASAIKKTPSKTLHIDKIGQDFVLAFDEIKRLLAICSSTKHQLHIFACDETFNNLQAYGSAINLLPWYPSGMSVVHARFVTGTEEILLVDASAQARIFSLVSQQFRPATLQLQHVPRTIYSTPDGACFIALMEAETGPALMAYHWSTFGSTQGIIVPVPDFPLENAVATSFVNRSSVHIMGLDLDRRTCRSIALDISQKATEFTFTQKGLKAKQNEGPQSLHNCLIDCHSDVWTRFPVAPAVRRGTITHRSQRYQKSLTFVTDRDHRAFRPYFTEMIQSFEKRTRKPTGDELQSIQVTAVHYDAFVKSASTEWTTVSHFRAGEWLVDLFCLIPIHLAVCRENRFIPLKDGVFSSELEKSLLGAEVNRIVDCLSFGWYESLFQSYLASKPVKVVSSMGEQSVGKSFALNHLVDTSFAGSAMRTTEGIWMSVTPTEDTLIVALDFEGKDIIERSAQEDTLLVLFNTAISNLVLFRNNFAMSRDITGLFQSFQSSSSVLDPAMNPTLFQSTLVIIIKDVVDSDKDEVKREFSLKFQKIVQDEKDANFITRLHAGKLNIIPWPVIESREFYKLFPTLKRSLDRQVTAHTAAGEFLLTIKTLMAKLKANDWGAMSQTLAAHRVKTLVTLLPSALKTGFAETAPEYEPLKNLDNDIAIDCPDSEAVFFIAGSDTNDTNREQTLGVLRGAWDKQGERQLVPDPDYVSGLSEHLGQLVDLRTGHVRQWVEANLTRFQSVGHASIDELRRILDNAIIDLRAGVQLCKVQCSSCNLLCVQSRLHEGPHDCDTDHNCIHNCSYCEEEAGTESSAWNQKPCGHSAGHSGKHICATDAHLCGEPCYLSGKQGCMNGCTKLPAHPHDEEHMCSALVHMCGQLCDLKDAASLTTRSTLSTNAIHVCALSLVSFATVFARITICMDCFPKLYTFAGLEEHSCTALCAAPGVCEIDTAPQSVEATFTGRNETFQYTKFTQVAKRSRCVEVIEPGQTGHAGAHLHSKDPKMFHFCETRCDNCGYYCTLPLGHPQQEHETSHGSMSQTRWAIQGEEGTSLDVNGRKFSANDSGAPMMCNMVCVSLGRHAHIDYCRTQDGDPCGGADIEHISTRMLPDPDRPKDAITHSLHWRRTGFKGAASVKSGDPYSRDDQSTFAKCDAMCPGPEHSAEHGNGQPSYCRLPMFHAPTNANNAPAGLGYISHDGHSFDCQNPTILQQSFHVIFVIDRSGSMGIADNRPLANAPATNRITRVADNRLGAVFSALYSFWSARHAAVTAGHQVVPARRDSYSVVLFDHTIAYGPINDFTSSPDELLDAVMPFGADGGTNFDAALAAAQTVMEQNWSAERKPVVIFLSDGECHVQDTAVHDICRSAIRLGKPLSFHTVSFGPDTSAVSLRRMAAVALDIQNNAPVDPHAQGGGTTVLSSYAQALDTVSLATTFLGLAESLRKPRGSLLR